MDFPRPHLAFIPLLVALMVILAFYVGPSQAPPAPESASASLSTTTMTPEPTPTASPAPLPTPEPAPEPTPEPPLPAPEPNRASCGSIRGTVYLSETERSWFLANCINVQPVPAPGAFKDPVEIVFPASEWAIAKCIRSYEAHDWATRSDQVGDSFLPPGSRGWFQIHGLFHMDRFTKYGGWDMAFDPLVNTRVAWEIVQQYGWSQWSTYRYCV